MSLEERLARLERANRWWRWVAIGAVLAFMASLSCQPDYGNRPFGGTSPASAQGFDPDRVYGKVRANDFELVGASGKTLAKLFQNEGSGPTLALYRDEKPIAMLAQAAEGGATLSFSDSEGNQAVNIADARGEGGIITLNGSGGNQVAYVGAARGGGGIITLNGSGGNQVTYIGTAGLGDGMMTLNTSDGKQAVILSTGEGGGGIVSLFNVLGNRVASLQADKTNKGALYICDVNGSPKSVVSCDSVIAPKVGQTGF